MVRPVSDYVQAKYDDMKQMVSTILDDGVETVNTDDAFNNEIGDTVDYLDPRWLVRSNASVWGPHSPYKKTPKFTNMSGSASTTSADSRFDLMTGTTQGSTVRFEWGVRAGDLGPSWDSEFDARFGFKVTDATEIARFIVGKKNTERVGFVYQNGNLEGVVNDGSSSTTTVLQSNPTLGSYHKHRIRYDPDTPIAEFYVDGVKEGEITSGFPSGDANAKRVTANAENPNSTTNVRLSSDYQVVVWL